MTTQVPGWVSKVLTEETVAFGNGQRKQNKALPGPLAHLAPRSPKNSTAIRKQFCYKGVLVEHVMQRKTALPCSLAAGAPTFHLAQAALGCLHGAHMRTA